MAWIPRETARVTELHTYTMKLTEAEAEELRTLIEPGKLRRRPAKRQRESMDYAAAARRMIRTFGRRAGEDVEALRELHQLHAEVDDAIAGAVRKLRQAEPTYSWAEIALRLNMSKQAAQQRFSPTHPKNSRRASTALDGQTTIEEHQA